MDLGFCVLVGIITMHNFGVYGQSLIKKRRYWPKNVPGDAIDSHFANKKLGSANRSGTTLTRSEERLLSRILGAIFTLSPFLGNSMYLLSL